MLHFLTVLALASLTYGQVNIETPSFTQCESATITWSGGAAPYTVYIYPEFYLDPSSFLEQIGPVDGTSTPYLVNLAAGDRLRVNVRDSSNAGFEGSAFVGPIEVASGSSDSCLADGPLGTAGLPDVPTGTELPSIAPPPSGGIPSLSSLSPGSPTSTARSSSITSTPLSSPSSGGLGPNTSLSSQPSIGGPVNGDGPAASDSPNAAVLSWDCSGFMLAAVLAVLAGAMAA